MRHAAVQARDTADRLLAYRWYPTSLNNWDGRLLIAGGLDLDQGTGCEHVLLLVSACRIVTFTVLH